MKNPMRYAKKMILGPLGIALALALVATGPAEARRGGSFGSRGARTYYAPSPTAVSPGYVAPVQRSMTQAPVFPGSASTQPFGGPSRPRFGGLAGGLVGGLLAGGLIGGLMGHGWGGGFGGGGGLSLIFQLAILALIVWGAMRFFRRRRPAFGGSGPEPASFFAGAPSFGAGPIPSSGPQMQNSGMGSGGLSLSQEDQQTFERLLVQLQDAFGKEDYARLREITTPEVMSYLAEEMSQNAVQGRRNDVSGVRLLQANVSETWSEADARYATVALHYESIDVMRDRTTGAVLQGDSLQPTQTTEIWTFLQRPGGPWLVSAVQET